MFPYCWIIYSLWELWLLNKCYTVLLEQTGKWDIEFNLKLCSLLFTIPGRTSPVSCKVEVDIINHKKNVLRGIFEGLSSLVECMDIINFLICGIIRLFLHDESLYLSWHVIPTLIKVNSSLLLLYTNKSSLWPLFVFILVSVWYICVVIFLFFFICEMAYDLMSLLHLNEFILSKGRHLLPASFRFLVCLLEWAFMYCHTYYFVLNDHYLISSYIIAKILYLHNF